MAARVAINGLGRIGRATLKSVLEEPKLEVVAVNDIAEPDNLAYLLTYDTVYGRPGKEIHVDDSDLVLDGRRIKVLGEKDPSSLPWGDLDVDLVFECTGLFTEGDQMRNHIEAGARRVVLSAPAKGDGDVATVVYGVNQQDGVGTDLVSCASCTTNAIAPVVEIIDRHLGVQKATMTTVHAYTAGQELVDGPAGKWRRGRAAATNIVPTTTGAAQATSKAVPSLEGRFDGVALRVPVPAGSIADIVCLVGRATDVDAINGLFRDESGSDRYSGVLGISEDPIVSSDVVGDPHGSLVDLTMTQVVDGDLVKVMAWYDNEWGYAKQMVRHAVAMVSDRSEAKR